MTKPTRIRASTEFPWSGEAEVFLFLAANCTPRRLGRPKHQYELPLQRHFA